MNCLVGSRPDEGMEEGCVEISFESKDPKQGARAQVHFFSVLMLNVDSGGRLYYSVAANTLWFSTVHACSQEVDFNVHCHIVHLAIVLGLCMVIDFVLVLVATLE